MSAGPLAGLRVLDLTRLLPGGYATLMLADLGADVLKVEEPTKGDYIRWTPPMVGDISAAHIALNRNKRSLTLNLKREPGRDLLLRLVEAADVLVESFRPGVMDRLGLGWETLSRRNDRMIYCAISGYGQDGPRALEAGHDVDYMAYSGALSIMGEEGRRPTIPGLQIGDLAGGGMAAVISILAALHERATTGKGSFCDVSMADGIVSWLSIHAAQFVATKEVPERERMPLSGLYPCYRLYPAADGWVAVGALEPQFWATLCDVIERPDLLGDAYAVGARRQVVIDELEGVFGGRTRGQWVEAFRGRDACVAPVKDLAEAFEDEQIRARGMLVETEVRGVGPWTHVGDPIRIGAHRADVTRLPPPAIGEHTDEVLRELGLDEQEMQRLRGEGIV